MPAHETSNQAVIHAVTGAFGYSGKILGLMDNLLCVDSPAAGSTRLTDWVAKNSDTLGRRYACELARRRNRGLDYGEPRHGGPRS